MTITWPHRIPLFLTVALLAATGRSAEVLIDNGFFEEGGGSLTGWSNSTSATIVPGIAPMSQNAARLGFGTSGFLRQETDAPLEDFVVDFYASAAGTTTDRSLNLLLGTTAGNSAVNLRLAGGSNTPGSGATLQAFDGSGWQALSVGDFFVANSVYRFRINGHGFGTATPSYDLYWSDANGFDLVNSSLDLTFFQIFGQATGGAFDELLFRRGSTADNSFIVDDVLVIQVPEPNAIALTAFGLLGLGVIVRRRRHG